MKTNFFRIFGFFHDLTVGLYNLILIIIIILLFTWVKLKNSNHDTYSHKLWITLAVSMKVPSCMSQDCKRACAWFNESVSSYI